MKARTPEAAARRELAEETGVTQRAHHRAARGLALSTICRTSSSASPGRAAIAARSSCGSPRRFEGPESEIDLEPRDGHEQEFDAWQWVTIDELPSLVVPFKRKVYLRVIEEFGRWCSRASG